MTPNAIIPLATSERKRDSVGVGALRRGEATIFYDDNSLTMSDEETRVVLKTVVDDEDLPRSAIEHASNVFHFKTPLNLVIADYKPERDFVRHLIKPENAAVIDSWVKSTDQDFYPIEYAWRKGEHPKRGFFNPDFFIKVDRHVLVIEIKGDEELAEPSDENKGKYKGAVQHFQTLNAQQSEVEYHFHFLTPTDYDTFFQFLRDRNYSFVSKLDAALGNHGT
jgi:type III restriction enzyme